MLGAARSGNMTAMTSKMHPYETSCSTPATHLLRYELDRLSRDTDAHSYPVCMRISEEHGPGAWAAYVHRVRTGLGVTKAEAARRVEVIRLTWGRWERGEVVPNDAEIISRVANLAGDHLADAMTAAGIATPPTDDDVLQDEELRIIRESAAPERVKKALTEYVLRRRAEQARERMEAIELALKTQQ